MLWWKRSDKSQSAWKKAPRLVMLPNTLIHLTERKNNISHHLWLLLWMYKRSQNVFILWQKAAFQILYRDGVQSNTTTHLLSGQDWFLFRLQGDNERKKTTQCKPKWLLCKWEVQKWKKKIIYNITSFSIMMLHSATKMRVCLSGRQFHLE